MIPIEQFCNFKAWKRTNSLEDEEFRLTIPYSDRTVGQYTYIELQAGERTYSKFSSGRSDRQLRNIAVFDMKANTTKWIFPYSAQDITEFKDIVKTHLDEKGKSTSITVGFLLTTEASRADRSISRDLWVMRPNGEGLQIILSDLKGDITFKKFGKNEHRLIVETEDEILVYPFNNVSLTLGEATKISMP